MGKFPPEKNNIYPPCKTTVLLRFFQYMEAWKCTISREYAGQNEEEQSQQKAHLHTQANLNTPQHF